MIQDIISVLLMCLGVFAVYAFVCWIVRELKGKDEDP